MLHSRSAPCVKIAAGTDFGCMKVPIRTAMRMSDQACGLRSVS